MLHIDPWVMLAQIVTFLTALALLRWIAYKPLTAILRQRAEKIRAEVAEFEGRVFTDSAPVMEKELHARPESGGAASTPCCCRARTARGSASARFT